LPLLSSRTTGVKAEFLAGEVLAHRESSPDAPPVTTATRLTPSVSAIERLTEPE
jgi:hypothetical protein